MAIGSDVRTYLMSESSVTTLIGTRCFPDYIPQKNSTFPCIVYTIVSQVGQHHLAAGAGFAWTRIQFDCYAATSLVRWSVAEALRNVLQGFPAAGAAHTMGSSTVDAVNYEVTRESYEPPQDNSDTGLFRASSDYLVRHNQAAATFA